MVERVHRTRRDRLRRFIEERKAAPQKGEPNTQVAMAKRLGVNTKQFGQYVAEIEKDGAKNKGWRPINEKSARERERQLKMPPLWLDGEGATSAIEQPSDEVAQSRKKNNVRALRIAIQSFAAVLHENGRDMAELVARDIVEVAGTEFARQGWLNTLLGTLRGAESMTADERLEPQPIQAERASSRGASRVK